MWFITLEYINAMKSINKTCCIIQEKSVTIYIIVKSIQSNVVSMKF